MEQSAYLMESIAGVICLALGLRLYWHSRRSARFSDRLLAIALLIWSAGYAAYDIPYAILDWNDRISPFFSYGSTLLFNLGNVALAWFVKEVFRPRENWAGWAVVAMAIVALLGATGSAWVGDWEQIDPLDNPGYWPQTLANLLPALWLGVEGLRLFARTRGRAALDGFDGLPRRQILILGLIGVFWAALEAVISVQDFIFLEEGSWSQALGVVNGALEIVPYLLLWWTYFPADADRRRIASGSTA